MKFLDPLIYESEFYFTHIGLALILIFGNGVGQLLRETQDGLQIGIAIVFESEGLLVLAVVSLVTLARQGSRTAKLLYEYSRKLFCRL